ncbi:hypothetical protein EMPS_00202 [Entomortierella parvispora]|uniref:Uncharacterized protein n=1 Tax=Entomortierella parvispora TaxID=205924 RepID=A0A9P3LQZ4_9FUNG|nr:hypothetical protein EMPS_00202 [Entomortierella parvispora]
MHFKPMIAAALVMTLGLVAYAAPTGEIAPVVADSTAPTGKIAPIVADSTAPTGEIAPVVTDSTAQDTPTAKDGDINATGFLDSVLWPEAFSRHCNDLLRISASLDRQIARAQFKTGRSCTPAQDTAISVPPSCPTSDYLVGVLWPLAFDKQDVLSKRIQAQVECLDTLNRLIF